jgi:hypothetical protein
MTLTAQQVTLGPGRISEVKANHTGIYWIEQRPSEKGRSVLMHWSGEGKPVYISPEGMNVGSRINEYGGGSYYLDEDQVYYPPSSKLGDATYADNRFIYVRETSDSQSLVEVSLTGEITKTIHDKHDFYAAPRLNPQTNELAFIAWDLPSMPWDHTHLYTMDLTTECPPPFKGAAEYSRRGFFQDPGFLEAEL